MKQYQLSLLALACGDAFGATYEFMNSTEIPIDIPNKSLGGGPFNFAPGEVTDDTDMSVITIKHLKKYKEVKPEELKKDYTIWAKTAKDVGKQISMALLNNYYNEEGQGNGALMRIIPAIVYLKDELNCTTEKTKEQIDLISRVTHINKEVKLINDLFIDKIYGCYTEDKYSLILEKINKTTGSNGWVFNTVRIVNEVLVKEKGFLEGFKDCIRYGGDTDTQCAIYGAYLGCFKDIREELDISKFITQEVFELIKAL